MSRQLHQPGSSAFGKPPSEWYDIVTSRASWKCGLWIEICTLVEREASNVVHSDVRGVCARGCAAFATKRADVTVRSSSKQD